MTAKSTKSKTNRKKQVRLTKKFELHNKKQTKKNTKNNQNLPVNRKSPVIVF